MVSRNLSFIMAKELTAEFEMLLVQEDKIKPPYVGLLEIKQTGAVFQTVSVLFCFEGIPFIVIVMYALFNSFSCFICGYKLLFLNPKLPKKGEQLGPGLTYGKIELFFS
jgi:hypothetical protein